MRPLVAKRARITGEAVYASSRLVEVARSYGMEGWSRRFNPDSRRVDYLKHLPLGIDIVIEGVEECPMPCAPTDVSPAVFEAAAQHSAA